MVKRIWKIGMTGRSSLIYSAAFPSFPDNYIRGHRKSHSRRYKSPFFQPNRTRRK
ncbi:hypothetical protein BDW66DRAFT_140691 [Aspergillus desertorum]